MGRGREGSNSSISLHGHTHKPNPNPDPNPTNPNPNPNPNFDAPTKREMCKRPLSEYARGSFPCPRKLAKTHRHAYIRGGGATQPFQLLLVAALRVSCAEEESLYASPPPQFSLTEYQHSNLAQLVQLTLNLQSTFVEESETDVATEELRCLNDLAQAVDHAFTEITPEGIRPFMWDTQSGISKQETDQLMIQLMKRIRELKLGGEGAQEYGYTFSGACSNFDDQHRLEAVERIAHVLLRSLTKGKSANFQMGDGFADLVLGWLGTYRNYGFTTLLLLACVGAFLFIDRYVFPKLFSHNEVPCHCPMCSGSLSVHEQIGEGGFGQVYKCVDDDDKQLVIKMIPVDLEHNVNVLQDALDEAKLLIELRHPDIVEYRDVFIHRDEASTAAVKSENNKSAKKRKRSRDHVCIVMEYCSGGTLLDHVTQGVSLPFDVLMSCLLHIARALAFVHSRGLIHFDVKLENVFITSQQQNRTNTKSCNTPCGSVSIKVGDFGLAMRPSSRDKTSDPFLLELSSDYYDTHMYKPRTGLLSAVVGGTAPYQSPECFSNDSVDDLTNKVDVWAVGCLMYEAVTCQSLPDCEPYLGQTALTKDWDSTFTNICENFRSSLMGMATAAGVKLSKPRPEDLKYIRAMEYLEVILVSMLSVEASNRPSFADVASNEVFEAFVETPRWFSSVFPEGREGMGKLAAHNTAIRSKSMLPFPRESVSTPIKRRREMFTQRLHMML